VLTTHAPTLLALLGTVLMAIVIFAPATATASAPQPAAPELYSPLPFEAFATSGILPRPEPAPYVPAWPALVDRSAVQCDADARLALVGALAAVRAPWADAILRAAFEEESDVRVRAAIAAARTP
jgi:hypothetical protein